MPYEVPRQRPQSEFKGGITILASAHFQYTEEGGTLDAALIGERYVPVGEPFVQNTTSRKYEPFVAATHLNATTGALNTGYADPVICDVDFNCNGTDDVIVGQLLIRGSVYNGKLPDAVTDEFRTLTQPLLRYVN